MRRNSAASRPGGEAKLTAQGVGMEFAGVHALANVAFDLAPGEILGLIGPNGAGKTTLVNVLSGFLKPTSGTVSLNGREITGWKPAAIARAGLTRSFQAVRLFDKLTVRENVEVAAIGTGASLREAAARTDALLERIDMGGKASLHADALPAGEQRRLGMVRALATEPTFLLLDEPAAGLNDSESADLVHAIRAVRDDFGCGILVIEHDMRVIMPVCERIHVLNYGETVCISDPATVRSDPAVIEAYLGKR